MLKQYRKPLIVTSILTLLPVFVGLLLWNRFPDAVPTHYAPSGQADGWGSVLYAVFFPPVLMLVLHWLCVILTVRDPGNQKRNEKMFQLVLWIIPVTSNLCCCGMYALALGKDFDIVFWTVLGLGLLFAIMGNYLPKTRMNSTMGIKVSWAYTSDDNWNATHRFAGKLWFFGGIVMMFLAFLPEAYAMTALFLVIVTISVAPMVYSWRYWKMQVARGDDLKSRKTLHPAATKATVFTTVLALVIVVFALFCGSLEYDFREDSLRVDAGCYSDYYIPYSEIQAVSYQEAPANGTRVNGFGNLRFQFGYYKNDDFGTYIRYTTNDPDFCVVVTLPKQTIVLSGNNAEETGKLFDRLVAVVDN